MTGTLKMFYKWRLAVRELKQRRRDAEKSQLQPPRNASEANQLTSDHLLWAEHHGLRPCVSLPARREIALGGKTVPVCQRCARVYARLQLHRNSAAAELVAKVRESCQALQIDGYGSYGSLQEPSRLSLMSEKERDGAVYYKSLVHHARHLHPKSTGRRLLLEHASGLSAISHAGGFAHAESKMPPGELAHRSASVDPSAFLRSSAVQAGGGGGVGGVEDERGGGGGGMGGGGTSAGGKHHRLQELSLSPIQSRGARSGGPSVLTECGSKGWGGQSASPLVSRDEWLLQVALHAIYSSTTTPPYALFNRSLARSRPLSPTPTLSIFRIYLSIDLCGVWSADWCHGARPTQNHSYASEARNWQSDVAARYHSPALGSPVASVVGSGLSKRSTHMI